MIYVRPPPDATTRCHASNTCLNIDSDASYLTLPKVHSRGSSHFKLTDRILDDCKTPNLKDNGDILTECLTLKNVTTSAVKVETNTIYHCGKNSIHITTTFLELNSPQPATIIRTDNSTCNGILSLTILTIFLKYTP